MTWLLLVAGLIISAVFDAVGFNFAAKANYPSFNLLNAVICVLGFAVAGGGYILYSSAAQRLGLESPILQIVGWLVGVLIVSTFISTLVDKTHLKWDTIDFALVAISLAAFVVVSIRQGH